MHQCLAPVGGEEAGILAKDNIVKDGNVGMILEEGVMHEHP